ncbi:hypothetical protein KVV02_006426 [Mortierella alpina]|uniref:Rap-GAP domain-containing protein n=1 Tax=Mortierella alpina TaxID=64518 RepID=A0A9P8IFX9_MORAP|nr:hypothetical protein KVV02_006426 [Mortierella alpina]
MTVAAPSQPVFRYLSPYTTKHTASSPFAQEVTSDSGCSTQANKQPFNPSALLQDRERDLDFYQTHFLDQIHFNYVASTTVQGPIIISMRVDQDDCVRILVRTTRGSERIEYPLSALTIAWFRKLFGVPYLSILEQICPAIPIHALELCQHPELPQELLRMEERQIIRCYKFGAFQLLPGQTQEHEGLANPCDFMHWLGEPIRLCGWKGYRAGLDVTGDTTGETSIFAQWNDYQVMFHCAPLLPFNPADRQQVERRRFIGNDIVVIVFKEGDDEEHFDLSSVGSRQNHVICIVRPVPSGNSSKPNAYRVAIAVKDGIRNFVPLKFPAVLLRDDASRDLLLLKLIRGERAAYGARAFATQLLRTRESLLRDAIETYC